MSSLQDAPRVLQPSYPFISAFACLRCLPLLMLLWSVVLFHVGHAYIGYLPGNEMSSVLTGKGLHYREDLVLVMIISAGAFPGIVAQGWLLGCLAGGAPKNSAVALGLAMVLSRAILPDMHLGTVLCTFVWMVIYFWFCTRKPLFVAFSLWSVVLTMASIALLLCMGHIGHSPEVAGIVISCLSKAYRATGLRIYVWLWRCWHSDAPPVLFTIITANTVSSAATLQLVGMFQYVATLMKLNEDEACLSTFIRHIATSTLTSVVLETCGRLQLWPALLHPFCPRTKTTSTEKDIALRMKFGFSYPPLLISSALCGYAITDPEIGHGFARRIILWAVFPCYVLSCFLADTLVVLLQRAMYKARTGESEDMAITLNRLFRARQHLQPQLCIKESTDEASDLSPDAVLTLTEEVGSIPDTQLGDCDLYGCSVETMAGLFISQSIIGFGISGLIGIFF